MDAGVIWTRYEDGLNYKRSEGHLDDCRTNVDFYEGRQWPPSTKLTRNIPRPVFNICRQIVDHKVSAVMADNIRMVFKPEETGMEDAEPDEAAADIFSRYADSTFEQIKQKSLNEQGITNAAVRGNAIWHYFFNADKDGGKRLQYIGEIDGEVIDPINFFPGNPKSPAIEKQPWIIITSREDVLNLKDEARVAGIAPGDVALLVPDKQYNTYDSSGNEMRDDNKATVLTMYWRDRETKTIKFLKSTKGVVFVKETDTGLRRYPVASMQWKFKADSFVGGDEVGEIIPNQKLINFMMSMQALSLQLTAWPKLIFKSDSVDVTRLTNTPGELVEDRSPEGTPFSAQYMNPPSMPPVQALVDNVLGITKNIAGATDSATGELNKTGQMNASAIMLQQQAAAVPLEGIKRRFYQAMEDIGYIWADIWRVYYGIERYISVDDNDGNKVSVPFRGTDYADMPLQLGIDIGPASMWSESLAQSTLDKLFDQKLIDMDTYLELVPANVAPFKEKLKRMIEQQKQAQLPEPGMMPAGLPPGMGQGMPPGMEGMQGPPQGIPEGMPQGMPPGMMGM